MIEETKISLLEQLRIKKLEHEIKRDKALRRVLFAFLIIIINLIIAAIRFA